MSILASDKALIITQQCRNRLERVQSEEQANIKALAVSLAMPEAEVRRIWEEGRRGSSES